MLVTESEGLPWKSYIWFCLGFGFYFKDILKHGVQHYKDDPRLWHIYIPWSWDCFYIYPNTNKNYTLLFNCILVYGFWMDKMPSFSFSVTFLWSKHDTNKKMLSYITITSKTTCLYWHEEDWELDAHYQLNIVYDPGQSDFSRKKFMRSHQWVSKGRPHNAPYKKATHV